MQKDLHTLVCATFISLNGSFRFLLYDMIKIHQYSKEIDVREETGCTQFSWLLLVI